MGLRHAGTRAMTTTPDTQPDLPTAADVDAAAQRLKGVALHTPLVTSPVLDALTGGRVFLKCETLQRTGSFKFRGAYNKVSSIPEGHRAGGLDIATITGHSLKDVRSILEANYLCRDPQLGENAIHKLETRTKLQTESQTEAANHR